MVIKPYDVYRNRLNLLGDTNKERIENAAQIDFQNYLSSSPNAIEVIVNELEYIVSILSSRQDLNKIIKKMLVEVGAEINIGNLVEWRIDLDNEDNPKNYWIVLKEEVISFNGYRKFYIVQCNKLVNWVDQYGIKNTSYGHQVGSLDKTIMDMYNVGDKVYHTDLNQSLLLIMPYSDVKNEARFIIGNQAWVIVNYDKVSVDGTVFITLKEDLINAYDDTLISDGDVIDFADISKQGKYRIEVNYSDINLLTDTNFTIIPILFINDIRQVGTKFVYKINNNWIMENSTDKTEAINYVFNKDIIGEYDITIALPEQLDLYKTFKINVIETSQSEITYYIEGTNSIKWGRTQQYILHKYTDNVSSDPTCTFTISNSTLATLTVIDGHTCTITANDDNLVGTIILTATIGAVTITKTIDITSLWQVI